MKTNGSYSFRGTTSYSSVEDVNESVQPSQSLLKEEIPLNQDRAESQLLLALLHLEHRIRGAQTVKELSFILANDTRSLVKYRQAVVLSRPSPTRNTCQVEAVSSLSTLDRHSPFIQWIQGLLKTLLKKGVLGSSASPLTEAQCPPSFQAQWKQFGFPHVLWVPLQHSSTQLVGGVWLARETAWQEPEQHLLERFAETVTHAWQSLQKSERSLKTWTWDRRWTWVLGIFAALLLCLPVHVSVLTSAEVVAKDPSVITAPLDGVVAQVFVKPNDFVKKGDILFRYEDTTWRNQYDVAEQELAVKVKEYRTVSQGAFVDEDRGAQMPVQASEVLLKEAERDYAMERLQQVEVATPNAGIAMYADQAQLIGKPVVVGERIMEVADPRTYEIHVDVPVEDAIVLKEDAPIEVFFHAQPLQAVPAVVTHVSYYADVLPSNILAYRVKADVAHSSDSIRIGWQGTAKIQGERVSLFFYLFRRPISFIRQTFGV